MDKYYQLAFKNELYSTLVINHFTVGIPRWSLLTYREQEQHLLKATVNILICNLEQCNDIQDIIKKRKRTLSSSFKEKEHKKPKLSASLDHQEPCTSSQLDIESSLTIQSSSSGSTDAWTEESQPNREIESTDYRCYMIKYMPNPELITATFFSDWKVEKDNIIWDIVDVKLKKMLMIKIGVNFEESLAEYEKETQGTPVDNGLIFFDTNTIESKHHKHPGDLKGIDKVKSFLMKRKTIIQNLSILEDQIADVTNLVQNIFVCDEFNEACGTWELDWQREAFTTYSEEELYGKTSNHPKTIRASKLLELLSTLSEPERKTKVVYKGKILPEGWTHNLEGNWEKDEEMVDFFINILKDSHKAILKSESIHGLLLEVEHKELLTEIIEMWETSNKNTFFQNTTKPSEMKSKGIKGMLGIGKKKRIYEPSGLNQKQKVFKEISPMSYDFYFEEIIRRLNDPILNNNNFEWVAYHQLLEEPIKVVHPIAKMSEKATTKLMLKLLSSNTASYSSKMTNFYSRLGGAYSGNSNLHNKLRKGISVFPIYSVITNITSHSKKKLLSGIVLRGPNHTRNSTDKIPIVTIEIMKNAEDNTYLARRTSKGILYTTSNYQFLIRPNSIMKEDTAYLTFTTTSMFNPINMLGLLTLENPYIPQDQHMEKLISDNIKSSFKWFVDRFTEGVLMASLGNSRDEGYFACLRKLYMVLYAWKKETHVASWDLESFCKKTNDCLIDNPLSMHFHTNLLEILKEYEIKQRINLSRRD